MEKLSNRGIIYFSNFKFGLFDSLPKFIIEPDEFIIPANSNVVRINLVRRIVVRFELRYIDAGFAGLLDASGKLQCRASQINSGRNNADKNGIFDELIVEEINPTSWDMTGRFFVFPRAGFLSGTTFVQSGDGVKRLRIDFRLLPDENDEYFRRIE